MIPDLTRAGMPARCAVVGAGAIGGSFAAHLLASGWDDLLVIDADSAHVDAINAGGLHVEGTGVELHVSARAVTPDEFSEPLDVVFLCVKSQATAAAMAAIAPHLSANGYVVSIQNGLNVDTIIDAVGPDRVIAGFVNWAADYVEPGRIHFGGLSHFVLGEWDGEMSTRLLELGQALDPSFPAVLTDNIHGYLWSKQVSIAVMFASGISHRSIPTAFDDPSLAPLFSRIAAEGSAVAEAAGVTLQLLDDFDPLAYAAGDPVQAMKRTANHYRSMEKQHTGLYRDLAIRQRRSEVDGTLGATIAQAERLGIDHRGHQLTVQMVHDIEEGRRAVGEEALLDLRDQMTTLGALT